MRISARTLSTAASAIMSHVRSTSTIPSPLATPPVFLVGSERSGTTLLRLMLDHHPEIAFHFEFDFAVDLLRKEESQGWPDLAQYHDWLSRNRIFRLAGHTIDRDLDYPHLVNSFLKQKQEASGGKPFVGATLHRGFEKLPRIWPDARYIHLVRDGRDVARSVVDCGWAGNLYAAAFHWLKAERTWNCLRDTLQPQQWHEVHFEQLVTAPTETLQSICRFIGVAYCPAMLRYHQNTAYDAPNARMASRWKQTLSPWSVRVLESSMGEQLRERGYQLSHDRVVRLPSAVKAWYLLDSRLRKIRLRCHRYGFMLWIQNALARRIGYRNLSHRTEERIQAIDARQLK